MESSWNRLENVVAQQQSFAREMQMEEVVVYLLKGLLGFLFAIVAGVAVSVISHRINKRHDLKKEREEEEMRWRRRRGVIDMQGDLV